MAERLIPLELDGYPHFSQDGEVIVQGFGFTGYFLDEWNNSGYCRVQKISCRFKELARIRHSCEKCGLVQKVQKSLETVIFRASSHKNNFA